MPSGRPPVDERVQLGLLATAIEHVDAGVEITDPDHRYIYVNPAFEEMTGYSLDDVIGRTPAELLRGTRHDEAFFAEIRAVLGRGETWSGRMVSRVADGSERPFDVVLSPIRDDDGVMTHHVAVRRDIARREQLQAKMVETDRLATVGQLAAGVAHEINNPLAYVLANVDYLREVISALPAGFPRDSLGELEAALTDIEHGAVRIRDIVRDLGAFSATPEGVSGPVDIRALLETTVRLLVRHLEHRATVVKDFGDVPHTWSDRSRLGQVFLNVLLNAVQAIPEGAADDNEVHVATRTNGDGWAEIVISDTGAGISKEVLPRIFDPFFTTRTVGEGTGLGLAVAHRIVVASGGTLDVASAEGRGTRVTITLPPSEYLAERALATRSSSGGGESA